jgi:serine/threonine-protein kinase
MTDDPRVEQLLDELLDSQATPEQVCASCPELLPAVRQRWRQMRRVRADLAVLFPSPDAPTPRPLQALALPEIPGYEVEAVLGHGGMGVVFQARHLRLERPVAVKMLLAGAYAEPREKERFQREAQAVARLRHPNVVQIHDIGDADGRPYFTMELVDGGSLAQKLTGQPQPAREAAELVATLAGAVQAAHACGIVHRDLKPANVLLSADGTPKIGDFGLARRLDDGAGLTRTGDVVGTPSYMAPEQARGRPDAVGPATDIYALGAILYELLTGRPPFRAETAVVTLQQVLAEEPVPPSRSNPRVPPDLETICLKCLEKEPGNRYPTAADLAADLERFSRHEPILARPAGRLERCLRWVRRRPAAAGLLAVAVLVMAGAAVGASLLYQQRTAAHARQTRTDQKVREVVERASGTLEEGWQAADLGRLTEARAEGTQAVDIARSGGASPAAQAEAEAFQEDATERLERARKTRALLDAVLDVSAPQESSVYTRDRMGRMLVLSRPSVNEQYAAAFRNWGLDVDGTAEDEVVERLRQEPDVVVQELIAGLDAWMLERRRRNHPEAEWRRLVRVADRLERDDRHRQLRALLLGGLPPRTDSVAGLVGMGSPWPALWEVARGNAWRHLPEVRRHIDPRKEPVPTVVLLARACAAVGDAGGAEKVLREAVTARPGQVVLLSTLGKLLEQQGPSRFADAIGYYRTARSHRPQLGVALISVLVRTGRTEEVEELAQEMRRQQPDHPVWSFALGLARYQQEKYGEAEAAFREVIELKPDLAEAHLNLGSALSMQREYGKAAAAFREAIRCKPGYLLAYQNLGFALFYHGKPREAAAVYREAIALAPDIPESHNMLGQTLLAQRKPSEAEAALRRATALAPDSASAWFHLGSALDEQRKYGPAEAAYRKAVAFAPDDAKAHYLLGNVASAQGRHAVAEAAYRQAIALAPAVQDAYPNLGAALTAQGKHDEAVAVSLQAIHLWPDLVEAHYNLGVVFGLQKKYGPAEAAFRQAIHLRPDLVEAHYNLGVACSLQKKYGPAEAAFRKTIDLRSRFGVAWHQLGIALMRQTRFGEAATSFRKAGDLLPAQHPNRDEARQLQQRCQLYVILEARLPAILKGTEKPADAAEQIEFARLCSLENRYATAARLFADALAKQPRLAEDPSASHRYDAACSAALAGCGRGADAAEVGDAKRAHWRAQARQWLRADLDAWARKLQSGRARDRTQVRQILTWWRRDPDLAGLRDPDPLARLAEDERKEWIALWAEVAALLARAEK